jgi:MFS family permease
MSDLVPASQRGRYFGLRNTVAGVLAMASTFGAGRILDGFRDSGNDALGYALIFGIAVLAAIGSAALIAQQPEPALTPKARVSLGDLLGGPMHSARFRSYVFASTGWALVTGIATPFFNAYGLNGLHLSFSNLALQAIVTSAVSLVFTPPLGRLMDNLGYRRVLTGCVLGTVLLPWGWVLSTPTNILPLWLTAIFSGVFWPGINLGLVNVLMERSPVERRGAAMASYSAITGVGTLVAGLLGGVLASTLAGAHMELGAVTFTNLTVLFAMSSMGRLLMVGVFWRTL